MHTLNPAELATGPHSKPLPAMHTLNPAELANGPHSKPLPAMHTLHPVFLVTPRASSTYQIFRPK